MAKASPSILPSISNFDPRHCDLLPLNVGGWGKLARGFKAEWIGASLASAISFSVGVGVGVFVASGNWEDVSSMLILTLVSFSLLLNSLIICSSCLSSWFASFVGIWVPSAGSDMAVSDMMSLRYLRYL
jgi:hypothetical protein